MALRCTSVILGISNPLVVLLISSIALALAADLSVLIATLWAYETTLFKKIIEVKINCFIQINYGVDYINSLLPHYNFNYLLKSLVALHWLIIQV